MVRVDGLMSLPQHLKMLYRAIGEWNYAKNLSFVVATVLLHTPSMSQTKKKKRKEKEIKLNTVEKNKRVY